MSKRSKRNLPVRQGVALIFVVLGFLSLLGELGFTGIGKAIYNIFQYPFGGLAWLAPFIFFLLALPLWFSASLVSSKGETKAAKPVSRAKANSKKKAEQEEDFHEENFFEKGIDLPKGKLIPLKGFEDYFSSDFELKPMEPLEELEELGNDFNSYFKAGNEFSFKPIGTRLTTLQGFKDYFQEVSAELEEESVNTETSGYFKQERDFYPGQVSSMLKMNRELDKGISLEERQELLGKPALTETGTNREDETPFTLKRNSWEKASLAKIKRNEPFLSEVLEVPEEFDDQEEQVVFKQIRAKKEQAKPNFLEIEEQKSTDDHIEHKDFKYSNEQKSIELINGKDILESKDDLDSKDNYSLESKDNTDNKDNLKSEDLTVKDRSQNQQASPEKVWQLPNMDLLDPLPQINEVFDQDTQKQLEKVLEDFGVQAKVIRVARGPVITRYELAPAPGVKISRIVNLADDIALGLAARDVRIEAPIPGKSAIGIEVPNKHPRAVPFREVLETPEFKSGSAKLRIALGKDIGNQAIVANLAKMPHLLVAGSTGSGKSVCITSIINSLLFNARPDEVKFLMIDPKMVELSIYNGIPHLIAPVVTDPKKASAALKWIVKEMETRYELFAANGVRDIERYNQLKAQEGTGQKDSGALAPAMPYIVVIIDELADLMMVAANEVEESICRLAQMARAAGIHLVIATQRPSVDVITGVIKANIPSRISFAVSSQIDSRTILDATGAEKLLGRGDMLYSPQGINKPMRVQGCMVTDEEVQRVIAHWKAQGAPEYLNPESFSGGSTGNNESTGPEDELFVEAGRLVISTGMASVSFLQRKLKLGYARAARLIDLLEDNGVVGGYEGSKPRQVLLTMEEFEERFG